MALWISSVQGPQRQSNSVARRYR